MLKGDNFGPSDGCLEIEVIIFDQMIQKKRWPKENDRHKSDF